MQILFNSLFLVKKKILMSTLKYIFYFYMYFILYGSNSKYFWKVYQISPVDRKYALNGTLG